MLSEYWDKIQSHDLALYRDNTYHYGITHGYIFKRSANQCNKNIIWKDLPKVKR